MTVAKQWIAKATSKNKGAFGKQAKRAGMSTAAFAAKSLRKGSSASTRTKRRASLARTLMKINKR